MTKEKFIKGLHLINSGIRNFKSIKSEFIKELEPGGRFLGLQEVVLINTQLICEKRMDPVIIILQMNTLKRFYLFNSNSFYYAFSDFDFVPSANLEVFGSDQIDLIHHILKHEKGLNFFFFYFIFKIFFF